MFLGSSRLGPVYDETPYSKIPIMKLTFKKPAAQPEKRKVMTPPKVEKRRSDKEIGLLYLRSILTKALADDTRVEEYKSHAKSRKLKDQHLDKIDDFLNRKVAKILAPIEKLLNGRGLL